MVLQLPMVRLQKLGNEKHSESCRRDLKESFFKLPKSRAKASKRRARLRFRRVSQKDLRSLVRKRSSTPYS